MYKREYLPSAIEDIAEAEAYLDAFSPPAAYKFLTALVRQTDTLADHPLMYKVYEDRPYFRRMSLLYRYICFYHVNESAKIIAVHRILRGMRDIPNIL